MHTTSRLTLEVPDGTDLESAFPSVSSNQMGILDNSVLRSSGTISNRPAATAVEVDHIYKATDTGVWYLSDGTNWNTLLVAGPWTTITSLGSNVTAQGGAYTPAVRQVGDQIELCGAVALSTSYSGSTVATLPTFAKPASTAYPAGGFAQTGGVLTVTTAGVLTYSTSGGVAGIISLDNLSYRLS